MRIFLSGPMGAGKSTVAAALARRLGVEAVDLDTEVARRTDTSISELFRTRGEAAFRALEREEVTRLAGDDGAEDRVIALGGGTVTDPDTRRMLLQRGIVVTLTAPLDELVGRATQEAGRPLLEGDDPRGTMERLLEMRADAYAECHETLDTSGREPDAIARDVLEFAREAPVVVPLGRRTYRVEVGAGVLQRLPQRAAAAAPGTTVVVVTDTGACSWGQHACDVLRNKGWRPVELILQQGETHKNVESLTRIWDVALDAGIDRNGLVVAVGGGMVGDLSGFGASTLLRGVALGQVPTTLLGMVDSSIGGKTGLNRPQGKNLIGTFHQPRFVLCDVDTLSTLPSAERIAGLAEVVKSAWLDGEQSVKMLEQDADALVEGEAEATARAVRMAAALKAQVVTADEREAGQRMLLNLGHTVGHALEASRGYAGLRHGEAVSLGMVAAFRVAVRLGHADPVHAERASRLLTRLALPVDLDPALDDASLGFVGADKKRRGDRIHFVAPAAPGATRIIPVDRDELVGLVRA